MQLIERRRLQVNKLSTIANSQAQITNDEVTLMTDQTISSRLQV